MNPDRLAVFRARAQAELEQTFPASVRLNGQAYQCAAGGMAARDEFGEGGVRAVRRITFLLAQAALTAAGQAELRPGLSVECFAPASLAGTYQIETVLPESSGTTITIRCIAPSQ